MEIESLGENRLAETGENQGFEEAVAIVGKKAVHLAEGFGGMKGSWGKCWKEGTEVRMAGLVLELGTEMEESAWLQILVALAAQEGTPLSLQQRSQHLQLRALEGWEEMAVQGLGKQEHLGRQVQSEQMGMQNLRLE